MSLIDRPMSDFGMKFNQRTQGAVSDEEGDLLYALVRMRKPKLAIETGSGYGRSTKRIAEAVRDNGEGFLYSCELEPQCLQVARTIIADHRLPALIMQKTGLDLITHLKNPIDFIFIDAGDANNRQAEVNTLGENLSSGAIIVTHDALNPDWGDYRRVAQSLFARGWRGLLFESPAGIAVFQKP